MKTRHEILEERRKLIKWMGSCDAPMANDFSQQVKMIDWILEDG